MDDLTDPLVRIETVDFDRLGGRQIADATRTASMLFDRRAEIEAGISSAAEIVQTSMASVGEKDGWRVSSVEATFGITLSAEAGVVISKVSADASLEVTVAIERI